MLKAFLDYNIFIRYQGSLKEDFIENNSRELSKLFKTTALFHRNHPEKGMTVNDLELFFYISYPATPEKDKAIYSAIFEKLQKVEINGELIEQYLNQHLERTRAAEISLLGIDVADGKKPWTELQAMARALSSEESLGNAESDGFVTDDLEEIYEKHYSGAGLSWRLKTLNRMLGPLRIGDFGFIFARPETGKTTILASELTNMAVQIEAPTIWFNNEQPGEVVKARIYQAYFGVTSHELFKNRLLYRESYQQGLAGRIKVFDSGSISRRDVERVCARLSPGLLVFDQIDKITGFEDDRDDIRLQRIYQWSRELAKEYGPVIGICQAGATAEGKKWLEMDDVNASKTGKQGEADWILGIGKSHQEGLESVRHLHLCKNKLIGGPDTIPELRHGKCEVLIRPDVARFEDLPERK